MLRAFSRSFASAMLAIFVFLALLAGGVQFQPVRHALAQGIAILNMQAGIATVPSLASATDNTSGLYFGTGFVGVSKHLVAGTGTVVQSTCGTSPSIATGSNDLAGTITTGSGATTCIITFAAAYAAAPACQISAEGTAVRPTYTTTTTTINMSVSIASTVYHYICIGKAV